MVNSISLVCMYLIEMIFICCIYPLSLHSLNKWPKHMTPSTLPSQYRSTGPPVVPDTILVFVVVGFDSCFTSVSRQRSHYMEDQQRRPFRSQRSFCGLCQVETIFIIILRYHFPLRLSYPYKLTMALPSGYTTCNVNNSLKARTGIAIQLSPIQPNIKDI